MSLQTFREDFSRYELKKRENVIKKIKEIIHWEELNSIFSDLSSFIKSEITVKLFVILLIN